VSCTQRKRFVDFSRRLSTSVARREKSGIRVRLDINVVADRTIRIKNNLADINSRRGVQSGGHPPK